MKKILTVVVPTYNMEKYLERCLLSLIPKDIHLLPLLEVLVINDGSKDSSLKIAKHFESNYPNVFKAIDKENGGHGSCCNLGLREAKGKYIHFLDSDDWFDTNFSVFLDNLQKIDADVIITKRVDEYVVTNNSIIHSHNVKYNQIYSADSFDYTLIDHTLFSIHDSTFSVTMMRNNGIVFLEKCSYDDTILRLAPFPSIRSFYLMDMVLYHYMLERPGQSMELDVYKRKLRQLEDNIFFLLDYVVNMNKDNLSQNEIDYIRYVYTFHAEKVIRDYTIIKSPTRKEDVLRCYKRLLTPLYRDWLKDSDYIRDKMPSSLELMRLFLKKDISNFLHKVI